MTNRWTISALDIIDCMRPECKVSECWGFRLAFTMRMMDKLMSDDIWGKVGSLLDRAPRDGNDRLN